MLHDMRLLPNSDGPLLAQEDGTFLFEENWSRNLQYILDMNNQTTSEKTSPITYYILLQLWVLRLEENDARLILALLKPRNHVMNHHTRSQLS